MFKFLLKQSGHYAKWAHCKADLCVMEWVKVHVWSRRISAFKLIDTCSPLLLKKQLINERIKTFKHQSKTQPHPNRSDRKPITPQLPEPSPPGPSPTKDQGVKPTQETNKNSEPVHKGDRPLLNSITTNQLKIIFPEAKDDFLSNVAQELNSNLTKYKLDTILRKAHFFAQVRQEAGAAFSPKQENLNYLPSVLKQKFSYYSKHPAEAEIDGRIEEKQETTVIIKGSKTKKTKKIIIKKADQTAIANKAYANRGGNGNVLSGDGWNFRGRGIFQLTARKNYELFENEYNAYWTSSSPDFINNPDQVVEFPYFIRSAIWYWLKNSIYNVADKGSEDSVVDEVTELINGKAKDAAKERRENFHLLSYPAFK